MNRRQGVLVAVADGVTNCPFGGSVVRWVVEQHLAKDDIVFAEGDNPADSLRDYLTHLHAQFHLEFSSGPEGFLDSGASLSVGLLHHQTAECLWAGDSPIYVSRKRAKGFDTEMISQPDHDTRSLDELLGAASPFSIRHMSLYLSCPFVGFI